MTRTSLALLFAAATAALATLAARPAAACSPVTNDWHAIDAAYATDAIAPAAPTVAAVRVARNQDSGGSCGMSSCGDLSMIELDVTATDDRAPADQLGYEVTIVGGTAPADLGLDAMAIRPAFGDTMVFRFDGDDHGWAVQLSVRAVDLNGNLGPPTVVTVTDPEPETGGCAAQRHGRPLVAPALVAAAALLATRRRRR